MAEAAEMGQIVVEGVPLDVEAADGEVPGPVVAPLGEQMGDLYADMQQVLNDLVGHHLNVHEGIRALTRTDPDLSPLQSFLREWQLMLEHLSNHKGTLKAYLQNTSNFDPWIQERIIMHRNQDVELLEKARDLKELPRVNVRSLEAILHGTLWRLLTERVMKQGPADFETIPEVVSIKVLKPLLSLS